MTVCRLRSVTLKNGMEVKATQERSSGSQGAATEKHPNYVTQSPMLAPCKHSISGAAHKNAIFLHAGIPMFFCEAISHHPTAFHLMGRMQSCDVSTCRLLHRLTLGRRAVARLFGPLKTPLIPQDTSTQRLFPTSSLSLVVDARTAP
jgi:hypothetical protein